MEQAIRTPAVVACRHQETRRGAEQLQGERVMHGSLSNHTLPMKTNLAKFFIAALVRSTLFVFVMSLAAITLLAQNPAPTPPYSDQAELSTVEEWVLSQGSVESIAAEIAATLGLGSDRLPVKLKSFRTSDGISHAFAVSSNPI